ncbi:MAG: Gfo/Idh/MocA family oxidoreductase [Puniceicoccales bacterium]|jgi:predicted dehydrogenase|nr:Gfo/Idh/MocA family oxidoreductase [Puniceicoccales bacterium]
MLNPKIAVEATCLKAARLKSPQPEPQQPEPQPKSAPLAKPICRRDFFKKTALALAGGAVFPVLVPASALGRAGTGEVAPSNRIQLGVIGAGQGSFNWERSRFSDVQTVAICEADAHRSASFLNNVKRDSRGKSAVAYSDFREMYAKAGLDAVIIASPDHWHGPMAVAAARAGISIWGEKPLTHNLREGRAVVNAVKQHGVAWQTGSWQRSLRNFREAVEIVRNGRLGKVRRAEVVLHGDYWWEGAISGRGIGGAIGKPPPHLDYEMWLGPAPWREYFPGIIHGNWRFVLDYGGGFLMDWIGHHFDIAQWGLDKDNTGPVKVSGAGTFAAGAPGSNLPYDAERLFHFDCEYADGLVVTVRGKRSRSEKLPVGITFYGENGRWLYCERGVTTRVSHPEILREPLGADATRVYASDNHWRNFFDCVRTRRETISPAESAQRSASVGHLGHVAMLTGRTIHWDPVAEKIQNDPAADALLSSTYRAGWGI